MNDIDDWVTDNEDFEEEEDSAFESAVICGRGWIGIDFVPDPNRFGNITLTEIDIPVHEVHFDPNGRRGNGSDWGYVCWDRWMNRADFKLRFPKMTDKKIEQLQFSGKSWADGNISAYANREQHYAEYTNIDPDVTDYERPIDINFYDRARDLVRIVHMEYWDTYKRYFGFNPSAKRFLEFDGKKLAQVKAAHLAEYGSELQYETMIDKKVKWFQFTGDQILYDGDSPLPYQGFSLVPIVTYRDMSKRTSNHYGIVRLIKDPQKEVNKRWSQALNMLNQQVQAGVYAETGAFVDDRQAEQSLKETGTITWVRSGAIAAKKFLPREVPKFPSAPMQMEEFSQDIMKKITGINPDLLGQDRGRQEAGVVIRLRQQQGLTILKPLFRSYNKAKKELFKRRLAIVMQFMPDDQILSILGEGDRYQIDKQSGTLQDQKTGMTANLRDLRNVEYNIAAEEAPGNMTKRMLELSMLMEMMQAGMQVDPLAIIEKLDMPASDKARWMEFIQGQQKSAAEQAQAEIDREMAVKDREIAVDETGNMMDFIVDMAKIKQMAEKDDKKMAESYTRMSEERKKNMADFVVRMADVLAKAEKAREGNNGRIEQPQAKSGNKSVR
jgi:hypothetical protein